MSFADHLGACKARWGIGRMNFIVPPGLYAIGSPSSTDPVVVTANYKMSFDSIRRTLAGRSVWLLVLETFGINVWCAAGKGTFGTGELVRRVTATRLPDIVSHRRLILPILGAPGVAAHQVAQRCGFSVSYAAIRAADLPEYLDNGMTSTAAMRELSFTFRERLVLLPVELVLALKWMSGMAAILFLVVYTAGGVVAAITAVLAYTGAVLTGIIAAPLLLPWLPGKSFAAKGALAGLFFTAGFRMITAGLAWSVLTTAAVILMLPAVSAFYTLNFTGCSTYTSRSGVKKEMRLGLPVMAGALLVGAVLLILAKFA